MLNRGVFRPDPRAPRSLAMSTLTKRRASAETCANCGKTSAKLLKCLGCKSALRGRRYCDKKCQKKHFSKEHKDECRLVDLKAAADDAKDAYMKAMRKAEKEIAARDRDKANKHFREAIEACEDARERYKKLGPRALGMELELCVTLCTCHVNLGEYDAAEPYVEAALLAGEVAKTVKIEPDGVEEPLWCGQGQRICGESTTDADGDPRATQETYDDMIEKCIASAWHARHGARMSAAIKGEIIAQCAVCGEDVEGLEADPNLLTCDALSCRHLVHAKCLPNGMADFRPRDRGLGGGDHPDVVTCKICVETGAPRYKNGRSFTEIREDEKREKAEKRNEKKFNEMFGDPTSDEPAAGMFRRESATPEEAREAVLVVQERMRHLINDRGLPDEKKEEYGKMFADAGYDLDKIMTLDPGLEFGGLSPRARGRE